jgi:hypothetical protein
MVWREHKGIDGLHDLENAFAPFKVDPNRHYGFGVKGMKYISFHIDYFMEQTPFYQRFFDNVHEIVTARFPEMIPKGRLGVYGDAWYEKYLSDVESKESTEYAARRCINTIKWSKYYNFPNHNWLSAEISFESSLPRGDLYHYYVQTYNNGQYLGVMLNEKPYDRHTLPGFDVVWERFIPSYRRHSLPRIKPNASLRAFLAKKHTIEERADDLHRENL